jgi:hypothetical protein
MGDFEAGVIEIIKWVRESVRPVYVILLLSGIGLLPSSWLSAIGMADWASAHHPIIVLFFLGSIIWVSSFPIENRYRHWGRVMRLNELAQDQKDALKPYIQNNKTTHYFGWTTVSEAKNLVKLGIFTETGIVDGMGSPAYAIDPWTFSYLRKHPELVGIKKNSN